MDYIYYYHFNYHLQQMSIMCLELPAVILPHFLCCQIRIRCYIKHAGIYCNLYKIFYIEMN